MTPIVGRARPRLTSTLEVRCSSEELGKRLARLLAKAAQRQARTTDGQAGSGVSRVFQATGKSEPRREERLKH